MLLKNKSDIEEGSDSEAVASPGVSKTTVTQEIESDSHFKANETQTPYFSSFFWLERKILNFVLYPPRESHHDFQCILVVLFVQVKDPVYPESHNILAFLISSFFCIHLHCVSILCSMTEYLESNNRFIQP